jgi:hypothetical protein
MLENTPKRKDQLHHTNQKDGNGSPDSSPSFHNPPRARCPPNAIATCRFPPTLHSCVTGTAPSFSCHSSRASEPNRQPIFEYVFILPMCAPYLQELHWLDQSRRGDMEQRLRRHWRKRCFLENESAAMCAYCRAPRIILHQGATRGPPLAVVSVLHCSGQPPAVPPPSQPLQETSTSSPPSAPRFPWTPLCCYGITPSVPPNPCSFGGGRTNTTRICTKAARK